MKSIELNTGRIIGAGQPCYVIAEIGINHNGSLETAKKLIDEAVAAKADAVKFQKRTPELCVPKDQWEIMRDTPWGRMSSLITNEKLSLAHLNTPLLMPIVKKKALIGLHQYGIMNR